MRRRHRSSRKNGRNTRKLLLSVVAIGAGAALLGCSNDEEVGIYVTDAGPPQDASAGDAAADGAPADAGIDADVSPQDGGEDGSDDAGDG